MDISTYIIIFSILLLVLSGVFMVKQQTAAVIERFGKFLAIRKPGLHIKIPIIDKIAGSGIKAILQPGGSVRDDEVISACNEHGIAMVFTGQRCFKH